jgi:protein tyrosine phosphatase (PTP) superfamily phosphohydrolase (DUF442 family)
MTRRTALALTGYAALAASIWWWAACPPNLAAAPGYARGPAPGAPGIAATPASPESRRAPTTHRAASRPAPATTRPLATPTDIPGIRNFAQVAPELYRGAQPTAEGLAQLKKMGIKTVVDLRSMHSDRDILKGLGLRYGEMSCKAWHPEDEDVARFLQIVEDPANQPVFVHCAQGADRTGYMVAAYRMVEQGWSVADAAAEMKRFGFHGIWTQITEYLDKLDVAQMQKRVRNAKPLELEAVP